MYITFFEDDRTIYTQVPITQIQTLVQTPYPTHIPKSLEISLWEILLDYLHHYSFEFWKGNYQRLKTKMNLEYSRISHNLRGFKSTSIPEVNMSLIRLSWRFQIPNSCRHVNSGTSSLLNNQTKIWKSKHLPKIVG